MECNRSVPYRSVPKSGTLRACVHTRMLSITQFRSKKWNEVQRLACPKNRAMKFFGLSACTWMLLSLSLLLQKRLERNEKQLCNDF